MISCKRATELISKSMDEPLSTKEELALALHNFVCSFCRQFQKQLQYIRNALHDDSVEQDICRNIEKEKRAKDRVKEKLKDLFNL